MTQKAYEVINCPLKRINGVYHLHTDGSFIDETGSFVLFATSEGYWEIWMFPITSKSMPYCMTLTATDSPVGQSWEYYSTHNGINDDVPSAYMSVNICDAVLNTLPSPSQIDGLNDNDDTTTQVKETVPPPQTPSTAATVQQEIENEVPTDSISQDNAVINRAVVDQKQLLKDSDAAPFATHPGKPHEEQAFSNNNKEVDLSDTESEDGQDANKEGKESVNAEVNTELQHCTMCHAAQESEPTTRLPVPSSVALPATPCVPCSASVAHVDTNAASTALQSPAQEVAVDSEMEVCSPIEESVPVSSSIDHHEQKMEPTVPPMDPPARPELSRTASGSCHTDKEKEKEKEKTRSNNQHYGRQLLPLPPVLSVEQLPAYTKPIPHMNAGDLASNWKAEDEYSWTGSRTTKYINRVTHEVRKEKPTALQYLPTVCSFNLSTINRQPVEIFAPAQCIRELGGHPVKASYDAHWDRISPYWSSTVAAYEHEIGNLHAYIKSLQVRQEFTTHREIETANIIASLEKKLEETQESERIAQNRADNMMARSGKSYIKRDWQQTKLESTFPAGDDFRGEFSNALINFETFVCDAVNCLEDSGYPDNAAEVFVQAMKSIHEGTFNYVRDLLRGKQKLLLDAFGVEVDFEDFNPELDSVGKLFWYSTQQLQTLATIAALTEADVAVIMAQMNPLVMHIHSLMLAAIAAKTIDDSADSLRIPKLVHFMLRVHAVALLSDPRCYLEPAPGTRIQYKAHEQMEILSPGVMRHGRIRENDEVEVVMCGLYFDHPNKPGSKPVIPTLVRRLLK